MTRRTTIHLRSLVEQIHERLQDDKKLFIDRYELHYALMDPGDPEDAYINYFINIGWDIIATFEDVKDEKTGELKLETRYVLKTPMRDIVFTEDDAELIVVQEQPRLYVAHPDDESIQASMPRLLLEWLQAGEITREEERHA